MQVPSTPGRPLLTKPQFADQLQVSQRTVDRLHVLDMLPNGLRVEIGGSVRFRQDIATEWIAAGCPRASGDLQDARQVDQ